MSMYVGTHTYTGIFGRSGLYCIKGIMTITWKSVALVLHFLRLHSILLTTIFTQKGMNIQPWYSYFSRVKNHPQNMTITYNSLMLLITGSIWPHLYFSFSHRFQIFYLVKCRCSCVFPSPSGERRFSHYDTHSQNGYSLMYIRALQKKKEGFLAPLALCWLPTGEPNIPDCWRGRSSA